MPGFETDPTELFAAQARVDEAAADGRADLARLESVAADVLGGSWQGAAASAFRDGYDDWLAAVRAMLAALDLLGAALGAAGHDYEQAETTNTGGFHRMAS